jgi:hypothetical protein
VVRATAKTDPPAGVIVKVMVCLLPAEADDVIVAVAVGLAAAAPTVNSPTATSARAVGTTSRLLDRTGCGKRTSPPR